MPESSQEPNTHQKEPTSPEPSAGDQSLRRAIKLITSLISLSQSIRNFSTKWQAIRAKLEDLLSGLAAVESSGTGENPLLSVEMPAILSTLDDCYSRSDQCLDLSYSGKLLMQSDLDIIGSKLDSHLKNLSSIYTNGIMKERYAIVASRPGIGASKEDVRFYVKDLLARVKVGESELRKQALVAFNEAIQEDERYIKVAVEVGSFFGALVSFLESEEAEVQEEAALAVSVIAGFEIYKSVLIGAGIIGPLIQVLETGSEMAKERCTRCLMKLTVNSDNAWSVSAHGGVTALLKICAGCDCGGELVGLACGVLRNLIGVEEIKKFMVEEGAISTFVRLLRSKDEVSLINAIEFLQMMASADDSIRQRIVKEDGARLLLRVLDPKYSFILKSRLVALCGIMNLCFTSVFSLSILMNNGFLDHILYFLRNGELSIQELALKAVFKLCEISEEWNKAMGESGFMPELVKLLDSKSFEVRELAAESLLIMISIPRNRKRFVQNEENVDLILKLLDPDEGNSGNRNLLLSILTPLTSCHSARKRIVHSGYMKHIEKLAEAEDSDAQRIVKKLSSNRLRSMWSGIWHS